MIRAGIRMVFTRMVLAAALLLVALPAQAYDPSTTHAGLTEQAVLASELHRVLAHRLSRPLGLFEPIVLNRADLDPGVARLLGGRLDALDPSGGYRPGPDGAAPALAWVVAGTVIAETPAERAHESLLRSVAREVASPRPAALFRSVMTCECCSPKGAGCGGPRPERHST